MANSPRESRTYLLNDGDDWFVNVEGYWSQHTLYADGQPCERVGDGSHYDRWWRIGHRPERLEMVGGPTKKLVGYRLPAGVTLDGHPAELTPQEFSGRFGRDDDDEPMDPVARLYEAVHEERDPEHTPIDTPPIILEGAPPPKDGLTWVAQLPFELREHPEYLHLFPGHIGNDFREQIAKRLKAHAGVEHVFSHQPGPLDVSVRVNYDPPVYEPRRNAKGRVIRGEREVWQTHRLEVGAPSRISGENRADAVAKWNSLADEITAAVTEMAHVRPCGHCRGRGWKALEQSPSAAVASKA